MRSCSGTFLHSEKYSYVNFPEHTELLVKNLIGSGVTVILE